MKDDTNRPGRSTRHMARNRRRSALIIAVGGLAFVTLMAILLQSNVLAGVGGASIVLLILIRLVSDIADRETSRQLKAERRAIRGAVGEEAVGAILAKMGPDYFAIHDVESPYGNIDHVVVTRGGGVFLIETKSHGGRVEAPAGALLVNGKPPEKDFIGQALKNALWLRDEIAALLGGKLWVTALLVFTNAFVPRLPPIKGVKVLNKRFLASELSKSAKGTSLGDRPWHRRTQIAERLRTVAPRRS